MKKKNKPTNEKEIREATREMFQHRFPTSTIHDEFTQGCLVTRNDLFVVDDNLVCSIEIKSCADNLKKLNYQVMEYKQYSNLVIVILDIKHQKMFEREFIGSDLYNDVEVWYYDETNPLVTNPFIKRKKGYKRDMPLLLNMMWSTELKLFLKPLKMKSKVDSSSKALRHCIERIFTYHETHLISKYLFITRQRSAIKQCGFKYTPILDDEFINDLIKSKQNAFLEYLKEN